MQRISRSFTKKCIYLVMLGKVLRYIVMLGKLKRFAYNANTLKLIYSGLNQELCRIKSGVKQARIKILKLIYSGLNPRYHHHHQYQYQYQYQYHHHGDT